MSSNQQLIDNPLHNSTINTPPNDSLVNPSAPLSSSTVTHPMDLSEDQPEVSLQSLLTPPTIKKTTLLKSVLPNRTVTRSMTNTSQPSNQPMVDLTRVNDVSITSPPCLPKMQTHSELTKCGLVNGSVDTMLKGKQQVCSLSVVIQLFYAMPPLRNLIIEHVKQSPPHNQSTEELPLKTDIKLHEIIRYLSEIFDQLSASSKQYYDYSNVRHALGIIEKNPFDSAEYRHMLLHLIGQALCRDIQQSNRDVFSCLFQSVIEVQQFSTKYTQPKCSAIRKENLTRTLYTHLTLPVAPSTNQSIKQMSQSTMAIGFCVE
jgi:hypothetical protein